MAWNCMLFHWAGVCLFVFCFVFVFDFTCLIGCVQSTQMLQMGKEGQSEKGPIAINLSGAQFNYPHTHTPHSHVAASNSLQYRQRETRPCTRQCCSFAKNACAVYNVQLEKLICCDTWQKFAIPSDNTVSGCKITLLVTLTSLDGTESVGCLGGQASLRYFDIFFLFYPLGLGSWTFLVCSYPDCVMYLISESSLKFRIYSLLNNCTEEGSRRRKNAISFFI